MRVWLNLRVYVRAAFLSAAAFVSANSAWAATQHVVYTFAGGADGAHPVGLIAAGGLLYGTTTDGGTGNQGTVFK